MTRRPLAAALVLAGLAVAAGCTVPGPSEFTVVGSFQQELGCAADWDPGCRATGLGPAGGPQVVDLELPSGTHEFKVTRTGSWDENYGAAGVPDGANLPLHLSNDATVRFTYDPATHRVRAEPAEPAGADLPEDPALAQPSLRASLTRERFYFALTDRFANGEQANDAGGLTGDRLVTGLDPTDKGFYHGGDLRGLIDRLDYIEGLGATALWLTPVLTNRPVQGAGDDVSAGYHGYWITDFTRVDPHLGSNDDLRELVDAAHARGLKVFMDIITNHTADVIQREEGRNAYVGKAAEPYRDATGQPFDDRLHVGADDFPALDAATSFPYTPVFADPADPADATVKVPAWLNDPTLYHNRGNSTFTGESSEYGDFAGLDDLFTEHPRVVEGMAQVYADWVRFGVDGFRIDTVKHVNLEFWQAFGPRMMQVARESGNDDFFMFAEVYDPDPAFTSRYTTAGTLPAALDFGFQAGAVQFAQGRPPKDMAAVWAGDDRFTDADSNAYQLPTLLGNHDMGRVATFLRRGPNADALLERTLLAHELMFLSRGQPVVYYGDEQGLVGSGGDKDARQSLFATRVEEYAAEEVLGGVPGSRDRYDPAHPVYARIAELSALREAHPALADGAQVQRVAESSAGILAFSRIDAATGTEYVVALNNSARDQDATVETWSPGVAFEPLYAGGARRTPGADAPVTATQDGGLTVSVPALSAVVLRATAPMPTPGAAPTVRMDLPAGEPVDGSAEVSATVEAAGFTQVSFWFRPLGEADWAPLGTDDNPDFRVFHDTRAFPAGTVLEYRAVAHDLAGNRAAASTWAVVG